MTDLAGSGREPAGSETDGRRARRDRNRDLVLDAALALFAEGHLMPGAPEVAARSGVSLRSVFRYYEDTESLLQAAIARHVERIAPLFDIAEPGQGDLDARLTRYVDARLQLYRAVAPTARAAILRAPANEAIATQLAQARGLGREQLATMFAPELRALPGGDRRAALAAADTLTQFEAIEHLVEHLGLADREASRVLRRTLRAVLAADGPRS